MKLELKHLSAYLPYGLEIAIDNNHGKGIDPNLSIANIKDNGFDRHIHYQLQIGAIKIFGLRPLSEFTSDDIMQVKEHLGFGQWCDYYDEYFDAWFDDACSVHKLVLQCPYVIMQFFLDCKFDVFNLIEQGLAIDINTLNK